MKLWSFSRCDLRIGGVRMNNFEEIVQIVENISEGIISINNEQRINIINKKAKEIFGISYKYDIGHPGGTLNKGDIIIIGDNCIGEDDGGIITSDFVKLGITEEIPQKSAFVYIGEYGGKNTYKYSQNYYKGILSLTSIVSDKKISVSIDFPIKKINICIDELHIPYIYIKGIGHMVILDAVTKEIKFYQSKGYTIRGEAIKAILMKKSMQRKFLVNSLNLMFLGKKSMKY